MSRRVLLTLATLFLIALGSSVPARADSLLFEENFNGLTPGLYNAGSQTPWFRVVSGSVDIINHGDFGLPCAGGSGRCVDLDGTGAQTTILETTFNLDQGTYLVQLDLAGSQRGDTNTLVVSYGATSHTITLPGDAPFQTYSLFVTFPDDLLGSQPLRFTHGPSGDNLGLLLDNVRVTYVDAVPTPEPATLLLLGTGLLGTGAWARRRRKVS